MRHRVHTFKIGRSGAHRRSLLANQVCSLISHGQIKTTVTKAKETRRLAEKMITLGKKGGLHQRRLAISKLRDKDAVAVLFSKVAPQYAGRNGGYTRIIRLGQRIGDGAETCLLQLVQEEIQPPKPRKRKKKTEKQESSASVAELADKAAEKPAETAEPVAAEPEAENGEEAAAVTEEKAEAVETPPEKPAEKVEVEVKEEKKDS